MLPRLIVLPLLLSAGLACAQDGVSFFEKEVRPLLIEQCLDCHSPEKKVKGGLRLDSREGWSHGGDAGPAIVPGDVEKSLVIEAVRYRNQDLQMPPKKKLSDAQIATLEKWVAMGAPDPRSGHQETHARSGLTIEEGRQFWSYRPVQRPQVPETPGDPWPRGNIDRFILAKAKAASLQPGTDASPEALVRRLYYVLIGLPPEVEEIDRFRAAFAADSQRATEQLVDELLASQHFGEAWGRRWLDLTRFAESSGGGRTLLFKDAWRYRDYVIESVNADVPLDRFITEQIAGDLLPSSDPAARSRQVTATAFLALGPTNYEEQQKQQLRFDVIDEQMDTIGRAFLGQTLGCARCHDHKFDPITQRDYYALAGIFASTRTLFNYTDNVARWIATPLPVADPAEEQKLRSHEAKLDELRKAIDALKTELRLVSKSASENGTTLPESTDPSAFAGIVIDESEARAVGNWSRSAKVPGYIGAGYLIDDNAGKGEKTVTFTPVFKQGGRFEVLLAYTAAPNRAKDARVTILHGDGEENLTIDQSETPPIDGHFVSLGRYRFEKEGGYILVSNEGSTGYVTVDALRLLPENEADAILAKSGGATAGRELPVRMKAMEEEMKRLGKAGPVRPQTMAVQDDEQISDTHIRVRGVEKQRGALVPRGFLEVARTAAAPAIPSAQSGRVQLAQWITDPQNPLTARVLANRVWAWLFGSGIVRTVDNFGTTGEAPSHPELLDYLAQRLIDHGWSLKHLVREIVLSRTWQLATAQPTSSDPENHLFLRAQRRRLDADQIRDTLLAVGGKLNLDYLGPNITGAGDIDANNFSAQNVEYGYVYEDTRRSVYTPAFRNKRLELFEVFDFADINQSIGVRNVSTVAPQALYLMNSGFVAAQAAFAAERTLATSGSDRERIETAFRTAIGRLPSEREAALCERFLRASPEQPLAAWTQVYQAIFGCVDFRYLP